MKKQVMKRRETETKREKKRDERKIDFAEKCPQTRNIRQTNYLIMIKKNPVGRIIFSKCQNLTSFQLFTSLEFEFSAREN